MMVYEWLVNGYLMVELWLQDGELMVDGGSMMTTADKWLINGV